jgi:hypothetical protein
LVLVNSHCEGGAHGLSLLDYTIAPRVVQILRFNNVANPMPRS